MITKPGVYDLPAEQYHADPVEGGSLSSTGARRLLPPSCPALYRYQTDNPPAPTEAFSFGHAAHKLVLGAGADIVVVDAPDWRTKAAREARDAAHAAGKIPLLPAEHDTVTAMAAALRQHPIAMALLAESRGKPEQTLIWRDQETGVMRRAMLDWLPYFTVYRAGQPSGTPGYPGRLLLTDYKTCNSAAPDAIDKAVHQFGYHQQAAWYIDGALALSLANDAAFLLVFQEKTPPYLVTVAELATSTLRVGRELNRRALHLYRQCTQTGRWPGYTDDVYMATIPAWAERQLEEATSW